MIDARYHIYSIAAVFFALTIGIVIGISMARSPIAQSDQTTIRQYERWMRDLKSEIDQAGKEASKTSELAKKSEEFCQAVLPVVAKDRLAWRNVALIRTGDYDEVTGSVKRALELAGAQVSSVTQISRNFPFDDDESIRRTLANCGVNFPGREEKPTNKLWGIIAGAICVSQNGYLLPRLEEAGVAKFTGRYDKPARLIVLVGGSSSDETNTAETVDSQLLAQLSGPNITVVGCEPVNAGGSFVPAWQKMGIATVDNADTAMGQIALICALGGERADFGLKDTADRMIPQSLELH